MLLMPTFPFIAGGDDTWESSLLLETKVWTILSTSHIFKNLAEIKIDQVTAFNIDRTHLIDKFPDNTIWLHQLFT